MDARAMDADDADGDGDGDATRDGWRRAIENLRPTTPRGYAACAALVAIAAKTTTARESSFALGALVGCAGTLAAQVVAVTRAARALREATAARDDADAAAREEFDGAIECAAREVSGAMDSGAGTSTRGGESAHSGWIVVARANAKSAKGAAASGEKKYARLTRDGWLQLANERGGEVVDAIDLRGCDVALTKFPGLEKPTELRWHKSTPMVVRHGDRAVYRSMKTVWLFALSSPAKEAWFVALMTCVERLRAESGGAEADARALDRMRVEADDFAKFTQETKKYKEESARRDAHAQGTHSAGAGAAGATINALGSRLLFDMFRDERWQLEQKEKLVNKMNNAPGTPKFVGTFEITHIDFGSTVPHIISARVPSFSSSSAPWDGASMPGRGYSHALELDVEYVGRATMTVQTRVDLSKYAQDMESEANSVSNNDSVDEIARSFSSLKKAAAREAAKVVASLSDTLSATPLRFTLTLKKCQGVMRLWIPPPPGDRLWWGLIKEPDIDLEIIPELGAAAISHEGIASRVSQFLRNLFVADMHSQLLLPNCVAEPWKELRPFVSAMELSLAEAATEEFSSSQPPSPSPVNTERERPSNATTPASTPRPSFDTPTSPPPEQVMEIPPVSPKASAVSASLPSSPTATITGLATTTSTEPPPKRPASEDIQAKSTSSFFAQAKSFTQKLERSFGDDFKDFTAAVKDAGVAGGLKHVSKNIEKVIAPTSSKDTMQPSSSNSLKND